VGKNKKRGNADFSFVRSAFFCVFFTFFKNSSLQMDKAATAGR
jgi:hypothetical protein